MNTIKSSQNGIKYAESVILESKQRVFTKAVLMRIPHKDPEKMDIALKVGRYSSLNRRPETLNPKSELTLNNKELNELIKYISSNYTPINMGEGEYVNVSGSNVKLIEDFKNLINTKGDVAKLLIDYGILSQNVLYAATSIRKRESLVEFEKDLQNNFSEKHWQDWFSDNKWILGSDFVQIIDERKIDTENIADYIVRAFDGFLDLVEIKKPNGMPFWAAAKDHDNYVPSTELIRAITQCLNYIYAIERESNSAKFAERTRSKIIKPRCVLIFGRSNNWNDEMKQAYRILNAAYNQVSILTYDHLLLRAKNVLGLS